MDTNFGNLVQGEGYVGLNEMHALGHCRENIVATIQVLVQAKCPLVTAFLSLSLGYFSPRRGCPILRF